MYRAREAASDPAVKATLVNNLQYAAKEISSAADQFVTGYAEGKQEVLQEYARELAREEQKKRAAGSTESTTGSPDQEKLR